MTPRPAACVVLSIALLTLSATLSLTARTQPADAAPTPPAPAPPAPTPAPTPPAPAPPAPTPPAPTPPAPTPPTPVVVVPAPQEVDSVDGYQIVAMLSDRRLPDGRATTDACGYLRDVRVQRLGASGSVEVAAATLTVACVKDSSGVLVAAAPTLLLAAMPRPAAPPAPAPAPPPAPRAPASPPPQAAPEKQPAPVPKPAEPAPAPPAREQWLPRPCLPFEQPKSQAELAPGELACVKVDLPDAPKDAPPPAAVPCVGGQKPTPVAQLAPGTQSCVEVETAFLKGELSHLGDVQLTNPLTSLGVGVGLFAIDSVYYVQLRPDANFHYGDFGIGVGAPLRFELANFNGIEITNPTTAGVFANAGRFRVEDWDQLEDFLRPLRYLTWGKKEDRIYADINRVHAITLGHGQLMRRYTGNLDIDEDNLFAEADGYADFGGFELMTGPFPVPRLAGALVFVKPLGLFFDNVQAKSWSVGASYVTDLNAPTALQSRHNPADQRVQVAVDSKNQLVWDRRDDVVAARVQGAGIDTEIKVLKTDIFDAKIYADYSHLFFPADTSAAHRFAAFDGGGATLGGLLRVSFGRTPVRDIDDETDAVKKGISPRDMKAGHALRVRLEARTFSPRYLPSYFNTLYEVDRLQFGQTLGSKRNTRPLLPTKIAALAARDNEPWRAGFYLEASYAWVDVLAVTAAYEDAYALGSARLGVQARNLALHVESSGLGFLQLLASYHYRNFDDVNGIFSFNTDNEVFFFGGRLQVLPFLFINAAAQRAFRVGFDDDDSSIANKAGLRFSSIGFNNVWSGTFDVEAGWQF